MSGGYQLAENVSLAGRNTFHVPARAAMMADVTRAEGLAELFDFAMLRDGPVMVLGEGSNLLFADDFPGVIVCLTMASMHILEDDGSHALVRAEAGLSWNELVTWTLGRGLCGLENMALIPGTVGACPIQNIGAYGVEVGEFIETVEAFHRGAVRLAQFPRAGQLPQLRAPEPRPIIADLHRQHGLGAAGRARDFDVRLGVEQILEQRLEVNGGIRRTRRQVWLPEFQGGLGEVRGELAA